MFYKYCSVSGSMWVGDSNVFNLVDDHYWEHDIMFDQTHEDAGVEEEDELPF